MIKVPINTKELLEKSCEMLKLAEGELVNFRYKEVILKRSMEKLRASNLFIDNYHSAIKKIILFFIIFVIGFPFFSKISF